MVGLIGYWLNLSWIDQVVGFDLFFPPGIGLEHERDKETKILETWSPKRKKK